MDLLHRESPLASPIEILQTGNSSHEPTSDDRCRRYCAITFGCGPFANRGASVSVPVYFSSAPRRGSCNPRACWVSNRGIRLGNNTDPQTRASEEKIQELTACD